MTKWIRIFNSRVHRNVLFMAFLVTSLISAIACTEGRDSMATDPPAPAEEQGPMITAPADAHAELIAALVAKPWGWGSTVPFAQHLAYRFMADGTYAVNLSGIEESMAKMGWGLWELVPAEGGVKLVLTGPGVGLTGYYLSHPDHHVHYDSQSDAIVLTSTNGLAGMKDRTTILAHWPDASFPEAPDRETILARSSDTLDGVREALTEGRHALLLGMWETHIYTYLDDGSYHGVAESDAPFRLEGAWSLETVEGKLYIRGSRADPNIGTTNGTRIVYQHGAIVWSERSGASPLYLVPQP